MPITVRRATEEDCGMVAALVFDLLIELFPAYQDTLHLEKLQQASAELLADGQGVWALLASTGDGDAVGVLTLNECAAIYAHSRFGEISELYVKPEYRSANIGAKLIDAAADFGRARHWPSIEVGAPDVPRWQRTVDFYLRYGFTEVGPRLELNLSS